MDQALSIGLLGIILHKLESLESKLLNI